jgi:hypothetical protein
MSWQYEDAEGHVWTEHKHSPVSSGLVSFCVEYPDGVTLNRDGTVSVDDINNDMSLETLRAVLDRAQQWIDHDGPPPASSGRHYILDKRQVIGNCVLWWAEKSAGYTTQLDEAELYEAGDSHGSRSTDIHIPEEVAKACVVQHVRVEALYREMRARGLEMRNVEAERREAEAAEACRVREEQRRKERAAKSEPRQWWELSIEQFERDTIDPTARVDVVCKLFGEDGDAHAGPGWYLWIVDEELLGVYFMGKTEPTEADIKALCGQFVRVEVP